MRCIIAGSRTGVRYQDVEDAVINSGWQDEILTVVSGAANGADLLGEEWAKRHRRSVERFPVTEQEWKDWGKAAGPRRNRRMAENADALVAVWDGESRGTKNMIYEALRRHLKVYVWHVPDGMEQP